MTERLGKFTVPADHPALQGHFPGNPVVPGAVLLDHAICLCEAAGHTPLTMLTAVKFRRLVGPDADCEVIATYRENRLTLSIKCGGTVVATVEASLP